MNNIIKFFSIIYFTILFTTSGLYAGEIHDAAAAGDLDKVKVMLEADPNLLESKGEYDSTPLLVACGKQQLEVVQFLIEKGANINSRMKFGVSVLCAAIDKDVKCYRLVKLLIDQGIDLNVREGDYETPLQSAVRNNNCAVVKLLIDHGVDPNVHSDYGTPLQRHICFLPNPDEKMAVFLVENGARAVEYNFGSTDLHLAAIYGLPELAQALIKYGADVNLRNEYGKTPLYYAKVHSYQKVADILLAAGADQNSIIETNYGKTGVLKKKLKEGEAYLWYLGGIAPQTGYAVKTKNHLLIFDPYQLGESTDEILANGHLNPKELSNENITFFFTRPPHRFYGPKIPELAKRFPNATYILSFDPNVDTADGTSYPSYRLAKDKEGFSVNGMKVYPIKPARKSASGRVWGLAYHVKVDELKIFHAATHVSNNQAQQIERYRSVIDHLEQFGHVDFAILPAGWRHFGTIDYKQNLYLVDHLSPKAIYYIGDDQVKEEHRRAVNALSERNVPVFYPDGGIAIGQRFHYLRD